MTSPYCTESLLGAVALISDCSAPTGGYPLFRAGDRGISLSLDHQFVHAASVLGNSAQGLASSYLVNIMHSAGDLSVDEHLVEHGIQQTTLVGTADLELDDLLGTSSCPLLRVHVASILHDDGSASAPTSGIPKERHMIAPGPSTPP